ncbi:hypothetical protein CY34DRAFT_252505 [Suillus luteus UH-Slu-Lm8-n1]|uniref:Uncharacterized protein n=1 Tax=Suillus luteus UH-Slu-Lm8-n1 TaxID=930992 RepID=A0A0D0ARL7_9AGAM|nr:hypothetical protein CY34DRAFT_252505 [Suillus luteus UH-Slu-Lm8-n1]
MKIRGLRRINACPSPDYNAWFRSDVANLSISEMTGRRSVLFVSRKDFSASPFSTSASFHPTLNWCPARS